MAIAIETCYQNVGVATSVALAMYDGEEQSIAAGVPLYYGVVQVRSECVFRVYIYSEYKC